MSVGGTSNCDTSGNLVNSISFDDWRRTVGIDEFAALGSPPTYSATFINKIDLNLTRRHHSISYGPNRTAAYVCNHLGPTSLHPDQSIDSAGNPSIDTVIDNTIKGKNLVACVAMDYFSWPNVNGGKPFTRFFIFGPSGELLPSVNLDGRREKFIPGTCVICHGGDHYAGHFPEDGTGHPDLGAHFLPYDTGNFAFSSRAGLTEQDQADSIYHLNQNALNAGPSQGIVELIGAWYSSGGTTLDKNYIHPTWNTVADAYRLSYAPNCRTCHVALPPPFDFNHKLTINSIGFGSGIYPYATAGAQFQAALCGGAGQSQDFLNHSMANSAITFDRMWETLGSLNVPDQVLLLKQAVLPSNTSCNP